MKYYLHDSNSFNDEKITELFICFGYEGLGLFYTLLEKLAQQEKPIKTTVLKSQLKVGKKLEKCWSFMEEIKLISSNNGETFNKQLMNFSGKYAIKKEKNKKRVAEWRDKQEVTENVTCYKSVRNTDKVKESKVNESKESNRDVAKATTQKRISVFKESLFPYTKTQGGIYSVDMVKSFFEYWSELNKSETKMLWEMKPTFEISKRLATWAKNDNTFSKEPIKNNVYKTTD